MSKIVESIYIKYGIEPETITQKKIINRKSLNEETNADKINSRGENRFSKRYVDESITEGREENNWSKIRTALQRQGGRSSKRGMNESIGGKYSTILRDMIREELIDVKWVAENLVIWLSESDVEEFMRQFGLINEDDYYEEQLSESRGGDNWSKIQKGFKERERKSSRKKGVEEAVEKSRRRP